MTYEGFDGQETIIEHEVNGVECMAFGAWHAMEIRPQLASFAGYDTVELK